MPEEPVRLLPDGDIALEILRFERVESCENDRPALLPPFHHLSARGIGRELEFTVAKTVGLLAIGSEQVGES